MLILAIYTAALGGGDGCNHSIHKAKEVGPRSTHGLVPRMQGGPCGFAHYY